MTTYLTLAVLLIMANTALAQPYAPVGVQTDVPKSTVLNGGWTECYSDLYENGGVSMSSILAQCESENLMLACSAVGGDEFVVLGQAPMDDVTFDTGNSNVTHQANNIEWYFSDSYSWGFAPLGESVSRNSCDTAPTAQEQRLCWHSNGGNMNGGWSCGSDRSLNSSED